MELKVWVEGIQRIVCGVNDKTTCQDVVFALAHATGKTGRFTLIERWRNSERLIAPTEHPLKVLLKWGEHSNDVQFILQWAPLETGPKTPNHKLSENQSTLGNLPKIIHGSPSVLGPVPSSSSPNSSTVRKISHSSSSPLAFTESDEIPSQAPNVDNMSVDRIISKRKESSSEFMRSVYSARDLLPIENECRTAPSIPAELESPNKHSELSPALPPPYREPPTPSKGNLSSPKPSLPPYREPPPPNQRPILHKTTSSSPISRPSSSNQIGVGPSNSIIGSPNLELSNSSTTRGSPVSESKSSISNPQPGVSNNLRALLQQHLLAHSHSLPSNPKVSQSLISNTDSADLPGGSDLATENLGSASSNGPSFTSTATSSPEQSTQQSSQYNELIKIINSQRQKLSSQQAELTKHDAEILFWEGKAKEQQRHMELINKEISRLELLCVQHESQVLSLSHLEEENSLLTSESETLSSQISKLRNELETCDNELQQCRERIRFLTEELQLIQEEVKSQEQERLQGEANAAAEIEALKKELDAARREAETVSDISGSLEIEVSTLEQSLADKKKKMEVLVSAMKEANLQSLTIQPSADELIEGGPYCRSGIQRRIIGSPRQLEYSAPTTKNPHGVWV